MRREYPLWKEMLISFMICTTCICIAEGVLGLIFMPEEKFGYEAFLSPPIFGFLSVILGFVAESKRELSVREVIIRKVIHLLLIEGVVFGLNYVAGSEFPLGLQFSLAATIAVIYIVVHVVLYINDRRSAEDFNRQLEVFQSSNKSTSIKTK